MISYTSGTIFMANVLILVPSRYGSSRFPGKPLALIHGKTMVSYIVANCQQTGFDYAIVTDDDRIENEVKSLGANVVRVDDDVETGSERIALALDRYFADKNYDLVVNMQGDEPLMKAEYIKKVVSEHLEAGADIFTAVKPRVQDLAEYQNPNIVKAVYSESSKNCLYFTRASAPHFMNKDIGKWFQHIGIYSYRVDALKKFNTLTPSVLEQNERLEQLRALEAGMTIGASVLEMEILGVDAPEDIAKIEGVLGE